MDELIRRAWEARENAYAPYSGYKVGAAIEGKDGQIWTGANFENVSFGATICAERAAVAQMVVDGGREIKRIVVATEDGGTPCGICLQVIQEFSGNNPDSVQVVAVGKNFPPRDFTLSQLMPSGFRSSEVHRT